MSEPNYELHKLGWRAFQDLCGVVLQEILGQTFTAFADTNDAGQDGAFHGRWVVPGDAPVEELKDFSSPAMPVVVQCKFSVDPSGTLAPSDLEDELAKIEDLRARGLCDGYMVLTNLRVTGRTQAWFVEQVRNLGVTIATILPGPWICTQIEKNWNLRRYVPRVYGLGDLTRILDERRMRQARALLTSLTRELETFVPSSAYRMASDAITNHGFVLLLGEPASGKSTIAAMLCMSALDNWQCDVMRVDGPEELLAHWNPDDPQQMFWIDDAFGSIRHQPHLTDSWVRRMSEVMAAVSQGARILMTSRDYIYREARPKMKEYAFPRLREQQVVIDIQELSIPEKEQMLYNHLKAGDQPAAVLDTWRPHLRTVASVAKFQPEVARRLSLQGFVPTPGLRDEEQLVAFFEHPNEFLTDVIEGLDPAHRAALAAVYLSDGELLAPFAPDNRLSIAVKVSGATVEETSHSFATIEGTFLSQVVKTDGSIVWQFRHPTIREGFAAMVARDISTLPVYLEGMRPDEIVSQLDCGGPIQRGTLVRVPPAMYPLIVSRVPVPGPQEYSGSPRAWFLRDRCSDGFLRMWAETHADALPGMVNFGMMIEAMWEPFVLSRLNEAGALPEEVRRKAVARIVEYSIDFFDPAWGNSKISGLFTNEDRADLLQQIEEIILPNLEERIAEVVDSTISDMTNEELYEAPRDYVDAIRSSFHERKDIIERCESAYQYIDDNLHGDDQCIDDCLPGDYDEAESHGESSGLAAPVQPTFAEIVSPRDPFEDVAAGH